MVTYIPDSSSRQLLSVSWLGTEALLFYSPPPGKSVTLLMGVREGVWATSQLWPSALWPPRTRALMWVQWPHISTVPSQQDSYTEFSLGQPLPQKAFAAPWEEELILTSFHSFLAQMGLIVLHIIFCSRKTTTVRKGKRASALYSHEQSWAKNSGICFLSEQHRELKPVCDSQQRLGWAAPEYTQGPLPNLCDSKQQPCLSKRIVWLGIWSKTAKQRPSISIKAHHL